MFFLVDRPGAVFLLFDNGAGDERNPHFVAKFNPLFREAALAFARAENAHLTLRAMRVKDRGGQYHLEPGKEAYLIALEKLRQKEIDGKTMEAFFDENNGQ